MSFDVVCINCGAPSSPTTGVCPYCKSAMASEAEKKTPALSGVKKYFNEGKTDQALTLAKALETQKPEIIKSKDFAILYAQILFEVDGPSTKIKSVLTQALVDNPSDPQVLEYLELAEADSYLSRGLDDIAEIALNNIIRRSPENAQALFLLGRHLFWDKKDPQRALHYLERCVRARSTFLRAQGCLIAVYRALNMKEEVVRFCNQCAAKTQDLGIKQFFIDALNAPPSV